MKRSSIDITVLIIILLMTTSFVQAQEKSTAELAKAAQNPIANMISFPFQNNTAFNIGPYDRSQNVLNIQPVLPFANGRIITRTIVPIVWQPDFATEDGTSTGFGDVSFTAFYSPETEGVTWGIGPAIGFPTGGKMRGSQKYTIGPSLIVLAMPGQWVTGFLLSNVWSFAGEEERSDVNQMVFQPFINYNFGKTGWYFSFAPIVTSNWEAEEDGWIVPLGGAIGKLSRMGSVGLPVNIQVGAFYNVVKPDFGPDWSARVQLQILLPKG